MRPGACPQAAEMGERMNWFVSSEELVKLALLLLPVIFFPCQINNN